jgi:hypothetical protein
MGVRVTIGNVKVVVRRKFTYGEVRVTLLTQATIDAEISIEMYSGKSISLSTSTIQ